MPKLFGQFVCPHCKERMHTGQKCSCPESRADTAQAEHMPEPEPGDVYRYGKHIVLIQHWSEITERWNVVVLAGDMEGDLSFVENLTEYELIGNALECVNACADLGSDPAGRLADLTCIEVFYNSLLAEMGITSKSALREVESLARLAELLEGEKRYKGGERDMEWEKGFDKRGEYIEQLQSELDEAGAKALVAKRCFELAERRRAGLLKALEKLKEKYQKCDCDRCEEKVKDLESVIAAHPAPEQVADAGGKVEKPDVVPAKYLRSLAQSLSRRGLECAADDLQRILRGLGVNEPPVDDLPEPAVTTPQLDVPPEYQVAKLPSASCPDVCPEDCFCEEFKPEPEGGESEPNAAPPQPPSPEPAPSDQQG